MRATTMTPPRRQSRDPLRTKLSLWECGGPCGILGLLLLLCDRLCRSDAQRDVAILVAAIAAFIVGTKAGFFKRHCALRGQGTSVGAHQRGKSRVGSSATIVVAASEKMFTLGTWGPGSRRVGWRTEVRATVKHGVAFSARLVRGRRCGWSRPKVLVDSTSALSTLCAVAFAAEDLVPLGQRCARSCWFLWCCEGAGQGGMSNLPRTPSVKARLWVGCTS